MTKFNRWTIIHALVILIGVTLSLIGRNLWILVFTGIGSFLLLIFLTWKSWTAVGHFGAANWVTLFRLFGVCLIGGFALSVANTVISIFGFILLISDGIDGWIASRMKLTSEFGEMFDKEIDAFFLLIICMIIIDKDLLGPWILIAGLLRYLFVLLLRWKRPGVQKEIKSNQARLIYIIVMGALLISLLPSDVIRVSLAVGATALITYSFSADFKWIFSRK